MSDPANSHPTQHTSKKPRKEMVKLSLPLKLKMKLLDFHDVYEKKIDDEIDLGQITTLRKQREKVMLHYYGTPSNTSTNLSRSRDTKKDGGFKGLKETTIDDINNMLKLAYATDPPPLPPAQLPQRQLPPPPSPSISPEVIEVESHVKKGDDMDEKLCSLVKYLKSNDAENNAEPITGGYQMKVNFSKAGMARRKLTYQCKYQQQWRFERALAGASH